MRDQLRLEPCLTCDSPSCSATVILPSPATGAKHFNQTANCLDLKCPVCDRLFSVSIFKLEWLEVDEYEFTRGFLGNQRAHARRGVAPEGPQC
jgi:hypothetical protein